MYLSTCSGVAILLRALFISIRKAWNTLFDGELGLLPKTLSKRLPAFTAGMGGSEKIGPERRLQAATLEASL